MVGWRTSKADDAADDDSPIPGLDQRVEEALLIARQAAVVAVANRMIVRALRDDAPFDPAPLAANARYELTRLAREQEDEAARMADARERARRFKGRPRRPMEYTRRDLRPLTTRRRVYQDLAAELRSLRDDDEYIAGVVDAARDRAWRDVSAAIRSRLGPPPVRADELSDAERTDALRALVDEDLATLAGRDRD